jgi:hypothetical protein
LDLKRSFSSLVLFWRNVVVITEKLSDSALWHAALDSLQYSLFLASRMKSSPETIGWNWTDMPCGDISGREVWLDPEPDDARSIAGRGSAGRGALAVES